MSAVPGAPGGPPAGSFEGSDPGRPPDLPASPDDDAPAQEPGSVPNPAQATSQRPQSRPVESQSTAVNQAFGQESPFKSQSVANGAMWDPWKGPDRSSWYSDLVRSPYSALEGLGRGAAKGEAVLAGVLHSDLPSNAALFSEGSLDDQDVGETPEEREQLRQQGIDAIRQDARQRVQALTPDPGTTGIATQIIGGIAETGELAITGSLVGGLPGTVATVGSAEGLSRFDELREQGVSKQTALESAGLTGVLSGAGALIPGGFGSTLTAKLLTGAGSQVTLGMVSRYADSQILEAGGYQEMADQQKVWDGAQVIADLIVGAGFGGLAHLHAPQAEDAARTVSTSLQSRRTAPGVPIDPEAASAHAASLNKATEDLMSGERVDVSEQPRGDYLQREGYADPDIADAMIDAIRGTGLSDEEGRLAELEAQLSEWRRSHEEPAGRTNVAEPAPESAAEVQHVGETSLTYRLANDQDLRQGLTDMKAETGQAERGGRVLMDEEGNVTGRSSWIARSPWWNERPVDLTEAETHNAVDKALAGERLGKRQQQMVEYMARIHDERSSGSRRQSPREESDRRQDAPQRRKVADMSPEEMRATLLQHDLTGLPNRRAYAESDKLSHQVSIDVDSLKWVNDNLGHEAGDRLLKAVGDALAEHPNTYHVSGDEFLMQAHSEAEAREVMAKVSDHLGRHGLEFEQPDGTVRRVKGLGVSFGIGKDLHEAEQRLQEHKTEREKAGTRAARGEKPPGADEGNSRSGRQAEAGADTGTNGRRAAESGGSERDTDSGLASPVEQIVEERPHLPIPTGEPLTEATRNVAAGAEDQVATQPAAQALERVDEETAQTEAEAPKATDAAVNCFMRKGST